MTLFLLLTAILVGGCTTPATKKQDNIVGIQDEEMGNTSPVFILGAGDTINITVYRKKTSEFILGAGDTIDVTVYRKKTPEFILGAGDSMSITVYRKKTPEFILGAGDIIDVTVYRKKTSEFILGAGDTLNITVYRHSDFDRSVRVNAFGMIMLPLIGDVRVAGKGVSELRDEIERRLSKYLVDPQVAIDFTPIQDLKVDDLSRSFTISAQKAGKITFPVIGEVHAAGRHVNELRDEIEQRLSEYLVDPQVTVDVSPIQDLKIDDLSLSTKIDSTGKITFPLIGDVRVAGKGVSELRDEIERRLSKYLVDPQVAIDFTPIQDLKVDDLSRSFTISAQKAGKITFPVIGEVHAAGRHVNELRDEIEQRLSEYLVDPQVTVDVSPIQDLKMDDLSLSTKLDPTGKITFPLIGEVHVAGKGAGELRDEIERRLSKYLVNPQVTINVSAIQSQKYHVLGEVRSPGSFTLDQKILAWDAISKAGGFTTDANERKVLLVRSEKGMAKVTALDLDIRKMVKDAKLDLNVYLKNGDIIYVTPRFIVSVERFMIRFNNIINPFLTIQKSIVLWPDMVDVLLGEQEKTQIIIAP